MSYSEPPASVRSLEQRIRNLEGGDGLALRRRVGMALVVVGQMLPEGAMTCGRLFEYRHRQEWPPTIAVGNQWDTLYAEAAAGLDVLANVDEAVGWANEFIQRIDAART